MTLLFSAALALAALPAASVPRVPQSAPMPQVGQPFPDFELPRIDGSGAQRLSDLRGQRVLLIEFASW